MTGERDSKERPASPGRARWFAGAAPSQAIAASHPAGHFYSPIVDPASLAARVEQLWPVAPEVLGIDFRDESHRQLLEEVLTPLLRDFDYPETIDGDENSATAFFVRNSQFSWLDARSLFALLRHWRPRQLVEVGSGFSSLLIADVNRRFLGGSLATTCIEPYPRPFLAAGIDGIDTLRVEQVQDTPMEVFTGLQAGDILFIDSSHVAKTGSDVNHLYFEVLPRLARGVRVHIHDIFLPHEYVKQWVLEENRSWNEQYLLRALLMDSTAFRVVFGCNYAFWKFPELVIEALAHPRGHGFGGGSFWIERI